LKTSKHTGEGPLQDFPFDLAPEEPPRVSGDRVARLERELTELRREVSTLRQLVTALEDKLATELREDDYLEYRGALFKRNVLGGFHLEVFCPNCRERMKSPQNELNFHCSGCGSWVNIKGHELPEIMDKLQRCDRKG
jgi:tRNA(Ile2) C34 agmatinyltransferase TiaS